MQNDTVVDIKTHTKLLLPYTFTGTPQWVLNEGCQSLSHDTNQVKNCPNFLSFLKIVGKLTGANGVF